MFTKKPIRWSNRKLELDFCLDIFQSDSNINDEKYDKINVVFPTSSGNHFILYIEK